MAGIVAAFIIGLAAGYCRYWLGYFFWARG